MNRELILGVVLSMIAAGALHKEERYGLSKMRERRRGCGRADNGMVHPETV